MKTSRSIALIVLVTLIAGALVSAPAVAADEPGRLGRWSAPFWEGGNQAYDPPSRENSRKFPTAVQLTALPDGRVLYWNGLEGIEEQDVSYFTADGKVALENSRARLMDPLSSSPTWSMPTRERGTTDEAQDAERGPSHDLFCADQKLLHDGTVLVAGGSNMAVNGIDIYDDEYDIHGLRDTLLFDASSGEGGTFQRVEDMAEPRWYPSLVTLPDGRVLVASGTRRLGKSFADPSPSFSQVRLTEIFDPSTGGWEEAGVSEWSFPLNARLHLLPDGKVFYSGVGQTWSPFGETADEAMWAMQRVYDPATKSWTALGHSRYGVRGSASSVMLRLEPPYDRADILVAGGTLGASPGTWAATTLSEVIRWTPDGIAGVGEIKSPVAGLMGDASQLRNRRWFGTPTLLPTGEVFLVNGGDADDVIDPGSAAAVRTPELYDPKTGTWREVAPASRDRVYHNSAVLLPDGRVLVGGHAPILNHYLRVGNTLARSNNFKDSTFEIYEPPYLSRGPRPVVSNVHPVQKGRSLRLTLGAETSGTDIAEVVLVRMGASTHGMDADLRAVKLQHSVAGPHLFADLPKGGDGRILPPGPYYVFAMSNSPDGPVPSIGQVVMIQPTADGKVAARML